MPTYTYFFEVVKVPQNITVSVRSDDYTVAFKCVKRALGTAISERDRINLLSVVEDGR